MPAERARRTVPAGLGASGRRLWRGVVEEFELRPHETELLEQACRTLDEVTEMSDALRAGLTVAGSRGQVRPHPLLGEVRAARLALAKLLGSLGLPDEEQDAGASPASQQARRAADVRWARVAERRERRRGA